MTKPDGYCAWSPKSGFEVEHTFCDTPEECEMRARWELGIIGEIGVDWLIKPVKILAIEEYERLKKLERWVYSVKKRQGKIAIVEIEVMEKWKPNITQSALQSACSSILR